jgi:hypothetical protein
MFDGAVVMAMKRLQDPTMPQTEQAAAEVAAAEVAKMAAAEVAAADEVDERSGLIRAMQEVLGKLGPGVSDAQSYKALARWNDREMHFQHELTIFWLKHVLGDSDHIGEEGGELCKYHYLPDYQQPPDHRLLFKVLEALPPSQLKIDVFRQLLHRDVIIGGGVGGAGGAGGGGGGGGGGGDGGGGANSGSKGKKGPMRFSRADRKWYNKQGFKIFYGDWGWKQKWDSGGKRDKTPWPTYTCRYCKQEGKHWYEECPEPS